MCSNQIVTNILSVYLSEEVIKDNLLYGFIENEVIQITSALKISCENAFIIKDNLCHESTKIECVTFNFQTSDWMIGGCKHEIIKNNMHKCTCDHTGDIAIMALANVVCFLYLKILKL